MIRRKTALVKNAREGWGGSRLDSQTHAEMFRTQTPTYFGMLDASIFSAAIDSQQINKRWVYLTEAQGNVYYTDPGQSRYSWRMMGKIEADARITRVDANLGTQPGKMKTEFKIYLDRGWFHEPILLKTDSDESPLLRIVGHPTQTSLGDWEYVCVLQTGSDATFIDPKYLQVNGRVIDAATSGGDELYEKYGGDYFANRFELESQIGYVSRKVEVTDKFIRMEKAGIPFSYSIKGAGGGTFADSKALGVGYTYQPGLADKTKAAEYKQGSFVTMAEARLGERLNEDKNNLMEFGQIETTTDWDKGRQITVGAGWRQIRRESPHYYEHSGDLTLYDIASRLEAVYNTVVAPGGPSVVLSTGKAGLAWFSRMVNAEAGFSPFILSGDFFIERNSDTGIHSNPLTWGFQFTRIKMANGLELVVMYDPSKDNTRLYREKVPGTDYTYESFTFDVVDLADVDGAPQMAKTRSNVAMVKESMKEEYFNVGNVYDIHTGAITNGGKVASTDKMAGIYRESSCALAIWDVSRVLSFVYKRA